MGCRWEKGWGCRVATEEGKLLALVASPTLFSLIIVITLYSILFSVYASFILQYKQKTKLRKKKNETEMKSRKIFCLFCCNLCSVFLLVAFRKHCPTIREFYCLEMVIWNYKLLFSIYFNQYELCALCSRLCERMRDGRRDSVPGKGRAIITNTKYGMHNVCKLII